MIKIFTRADCADAGRNLEEEVNEWLAAENVRVVQMSVAAKPCPGAQSSEEAIWIMAIYERRA